MIASLLILALFLLFAVLMIARVVPALIAVPAMAITMALASGVPAANVGSDVIVAGSAKLATVIVAVIFGAVLGRVTLDTGIARTIVNFAAEYGGERPFTLALVLCAVVALLFVSLNGLGAIVMVGTVVLPIMMTTGVPRKVAASLFLMAFALGFMFNPFLWKFYSETFAVDAMRMVRYAQILGAIDALALVAYAALAFRRARDFAAWAVAAPREAASVPAYALPAPVLPIILYYGFHADPSVALLASAVIAAVAARPRSFIPTLVSAAIRGVEDVAPAIVLFLGIGMLVAVTKEPQFAAALAPLAHSPLLRSPVAYVVLFGLLSPLALYRGPLNPFGVGIAVFVVMLSAHTLPALAIVAAVMAVVQVQNVCDPTNTANVWVANFTRTPVAEITRRTLPFQMVVATAGALVVVLFGRSLFGIDLGRVGAAASAAEASSLFASPSAAGRIAVDNDGSADARTAQAAVVDGLSSALGVRTISRRDDPNASTCAAKPYAAFVRITSSAFMTSNGRDLDIGLALFDCGGWPITEWHDHGIVVQGDDGARRLAREGVTRMARWFRTHRAGEPLLERGVAFAPGDPPTFYYTLFKTVDGNMRCFVRAGGPAYDAGMRSNDIVDKLDGKYWWEYGTYQTQRRAYDGAPHVFELERDGQPVRVALESPFTGKDL